jgi:molybdopterin-biosynthesis enzyme MoeA-like protein
LIIGDEILSGKRQDKHFPKIIEILKARGLDLGWGMYLPDEPAVITGSAVQHLARGDIVFCFGGIGATPTTTPANARPRPRASGSRCIRMPSAKSKRFGAEAYPGASRWACSRPAAASFPTPYNRVPGFSYAQHHFFPVSEMAWPMLEWVLDNEYRHLHNQQPPVDVAIVVKDAGESQLIDLMNACIARYPGIRLFSLPSLLPPAAASSSA